VDVLGVEDAGAAWHGTLTYHPSCHLLRGLGVRDAPAKLLSHVRGAEVLPLPNAETCCGFGGLFAIKHADISAAMLDKKLAAILATAAGAVVGCDMSCLMHMQGALARERSPIKCVHLAEVLASQ
jgi:L-lactate dehydrogenase complex protein LldE